MKSQHGLFGVLSVVALVAGALYIARSDRSSGTPENPPSTIDPEQARLLADSRRAMEKLSANLATANAELRATTTTKKSLDSQLGEVKKELDETKRARATADKAARAQRDELALVKTRADDLAANQAAALQAQERLGAEVTRLRSALAEAKSRADSAAAALAETKKQPPTASKAEAVASTEPLRFRVHEGGFVTAFGHRIYVAKDRPAIVILDRQLEVRFRLGEIVVVDDLILRLEGEDLDGDAIQFEVRKKPQTGDATAARTPGRRP